jgi:hypothetical protein
LPRDAADGDRLSRRDAGQPCRIFEHLPEHCSGCCRFATVNLVEDATVGAILLWLLGIPIPIIIILLLLWH